MFEKSGPLKQLEAILFIFGLALVPFMDYAVAPDSWFWCLFIPVFLLVPANLVIAIGLVNGLFLAIFPFLGGFPVDVVLLGVLIAASLHLRTQGRLLAPHDAGARKYFVRCMAPLFRVAFPLMALYLLYTLIFRDTHVARTSCWAAELIILRSALPPSPNAPARPMLAATGNVIAAILSIAFSLALVEGGARAFLPKPDLPPMLEQSVYQVHPQALWVFAKEKTAEFFIQATPDAKKYFSVTTSSQGLRNPELAPKKPDEFRVAILGDSLTMGWGLEEEEAIARRLEANLAERLGPGRVTVINGGINGYGPWQERIFLNEFIMPHEPDLVILQLFPQNDIENTLVKWDELPESYNVEWLKIIDFWRYNGQWQLHTERYARNYSWAYHHLRETVLTDWEVQDYLDEIRWVDRVRTHRLPTLADRPFFLEALLSEYYPGLQKGWDEFARDVERIQKDCSKKDVAIASFVLPGYHAAIDPLWEESMALVDPKDYERGIDIRMTKELYKKLDMPEVKIAEAIMNHDDPRSLFFVPDGHLTAEGVAVASQLLGDYVIENHFPEEAHHAASPPKESTTP
jgi:hypothetical protein